MRVLAGIIIAVLAFLYAFADEEGEKDEHDGE